MNPCHLIVDAANFAAIAHKDQKRKASGVPYVNHVIGVASILANEFDVTDSQVLAAALLHDTIEDCPPINKEQLSEKFGPRVAHLVDLVTDDKLLTTGQRKRLQVEHAKDPLFDRDARFIKAADSIYNLRDLQELPPPGWTVERIQGYFAWKALIYLHGLQNLHVNIDVAFRDCFSKTFLFQGELVETLPIYHYYHCRPISEFIEALEPIVEAYCESFH